jgi:hypothetical protein
VEALLEGNCSQNKSLEAKCCRHPLSLPLILTRDFLTLKSHGKTLSIGIPR